MQSFEIWWNDLTPEAKERLHDLYHENVELTPLAIIDIENEDEDDEDAEEYDDIDNYLIG